VLLLARGLNNRGTEVKLVCSPGGVLARRARNEGIAVWEIPIRGEWDALAAWRIGSMATEVDLLHSNTAHTHALALMAVRIGAMRPVVVHRRVCFEPGKGAFSRWKYRTPDKFIAISNAVSQVLKSVGVPLPKIRVVHSGVDPSDVESAPIADVRKKLNLAPDTPIVGNIAQLDDSKGHQYLIDATPELLAAVPEAHVVIAGTGPLEGNLQKKIKKLKLDDQVHLLGWRDDPLSLLKSFDLFAMSSHLEGMGTAVLDAFAARVPVVATDAGGLGEMVKDGITGRLVPARDPAALAKAMIESISEKDQSAQMAENAEKVLHEQYTADRMVNRVLDVYREIVK